MRQSLRNTCIKVIIQARESKISTHFVTFHQFSVFNRSRVCKDGNNKIPIKKSIKVGKIMEDDAVPEAENLLLPSRLSPISDSEKKNLEKEDVKSKEEEEEERGGLITHLISSLVSPRSPKTGKVFDKKLEIENEDSKAFDDLGSNSNGKGQNQNEGVLNNMVSNLFKNNKNQETDEMEDNEARKRLKTEKEGERRGGGIIDNIVSHFPSYITDDAVPTSDEASILINSIVRD